MKKKTLTLVLISVFLFLISNETVVESKSDNYWPTEKWRNATPESQGMDSEILNNMLNFITMSGKAIRSVIVVRNGYMITEAYFYPFKKKMWHIMHSCSKSIMSSLIGIALEKKLISNINTPVINYFNGLNISNLDERKKSINLKHLLTMSSGLDTKDSYLYNFSGFRELTSSRDWVKFILSIPMKENPGESFEYSNSVTFLLSAILQNQTGMDALKFAKRHLFKPLGIDQVDWMKNSEGICFGWGGIRMKPVDMAKFGYLYLKKGLWDKKQIIPVSWINDSVKTQIRSATLSDNYGYQWWIDDAGYFMALGYRGQYIIVVPKKNLVVVFCSALEDRDFFLPEQLLHMYILPSIKSDEGLEPNAKKYGLLKKNLESISKPNDAKPYNLPESAYKISGKKFIHDPNPYYLKSFSFEFNKNTPFARLNYGYRGMNINGEVGLDNVYRISYSGGYWRAYKGNWKNDKTFVMDFQIMDLTQRGQAIFKFKGDKVYISQEDKISGNKLQFSAYLGKKTELKQDLPPGPDTAGPWKKLQDEMSCFQTCGKIFCRKMTGFHDKVTNFSDYNESGT